MLIYRVLNERSRLDELAQKLDLSIKKANYGDSAYCKEDWMKLKIPIVEIENLYSAIMRAKKGIDIVFEKNDRKMK